MIVHGLESSQIENSRKFFNHECISSFRKRGTALEEIDLSAKTLIYDALCEHGIQLINVCPGGIFSHFTLLAALK